MPIIDFLFPKYCLSCKQKGKYICNDCLSQVRPSLLKCPVCNGSSLSGQTHVECNKSVCLSGLIPVWSYSGVIKKAILTMKYNFRFDIGNELAALMVNYLQNSTPLSFSKETVLIPIPLHIKRENWRGFNQAAEVGERIAKEMGWEYREDVLIRRINTVHQVGLRGIERLNNMHNAFSVNPKSSLANNKQVIIFDDVYTTGSTMKSAANVLRIAKAKNIWGLSIAR